MESNVSQAEEQPFPEIALTASNGHFSAKPTPQFKLFPPRQLLFRDDVC